MKARVKDTLIKKLSEELRDIKLEKAQTDFISSVIIDFIKEFGLEEKFNEYVIKKVGENNES